MEKFNELFLDDCGITFLVNSDSTTIELIDNISHTTFVRMELTPEQLSSALSRLSNTRCKVHVRGLNRLGKKHENKYFEFKLPKELAMDRYSNDFKLKLGEYCNKICPEGWTPDNYFNSQDSIFYKGAGKDREEWARVVIRRWI